MRGHIDQEKQRLEVMGGERRGEKSSVEDDAGGLVEGVVKIGARKRERVDEALSGVGEGGDEDGFAERAGLEGKKRKLDLEEIVWVGGT